MKILFVQPAEYEVAILDENVRVLSEVPDADVIGITAMGANMERAFDQDPHPRNIAL